MKTKTKTKTDTAAPAAVYLHGTSRKAAEAIKVQGLIPRASAGADTWASQNGKKIPVTAAPSVFLTEHPANAYFFANLAAQEAGEAGNGYVVTVRLTEDQRAKLIPDSASEPDPFNGRQENWRYAGSLPATVVVAIEPNTRPASAISSVRDNPMAALLSRLSGCDS